ncbi:hypothetical protein D3C84_874140 [compost metagenome]
MASSLPSTAHSISRPLTADSISTFSSKLNASSTAAAYPASSVTLLTPTEDPWLAGLTNSGRPSLPLTSAKPVRAALARVRVTNGVTARPASRNRRLLMSLSMQTADPSTSEPTNGKSAMRSKPCRQPSSPRVPWTIGKITSTWPSNSGPAVSTSC